MPVNTGDTISIPSDHGSNIVTVKWSQNLISRTETYYSLSYTKDGETISRGPFFVEVDMWDELKNRSNVDGDKMTVRINGDFQYGQKDSSGEYRFIVYHNKEHKPYQHRFVETTLTSGGADVARQIADSWGIHADEALNIAKDFVGDYMHTF